jgi:hypothetical protein
MQRQWQLSTQSCHDSNRPIAAIRILRHYRRVHRFLVILMLALSSSCSSEETFCCGYSVQDQGGSKHSLMRSGLVVESYIVTGVLNAPNLTVFELHPYDANECSYRVATPPDRLSQAMKLGELDKVRSGLIAAVKGHDFEPINSHSCMSPQS